MAILTSDAQPATLDGDIRQQQRWQSSAKNAVRPTLAWPREE